MSTRLTHHRRSLSDRLNAYIEARASAVMIKRTQDADDACERISDALTTEQDKVRGLQVTNRRLLDKLGEVEHDRDQALADKDQALESCATLSRTVKVLEEKNDRLLSLNRMLLDVVQGRTSVADEVEAFLAHPSNGGEG